MHFDRWWNPAVENQATDRAFRIGQRRNVLVHKFVCRGTVEERIDSLIQSKQHVADQLLKQEGETLLTEMDDDELLDFVALDMQRARRGRMKRIRPNRRPSHPHDRPPTRLAFALGDVPDLLLDC